MYSVHKVLNNPCAVYELSFDPKYAVRYYVRRIYVREFRVKGNICEKCMRLINFAYRDVIPLN